MHCISGFSLSTMIPYHHWNVRNQCDVNQWVLDVASLVRLVRRAVFMLWMFCFLGRLGLIVAWQGEKKKKKVPYCFPAVDSCCYATNRMSLSTGYIKFVFPAHLSARSSYTVTGGYGSGFLKDCSMKCTLELLFRCSLELQWRQWICRAFLCFRVDGIPVQHNRASNQTKRGCGDLPQGWMILPSSMLRLQKGEIPCVGKNLWLWILKAFKCDAGKVLMQMAVYGSLN